MRVYMCGCATDHGRGEFCRRIVSPTYFFSEFLADYVTEADGELVRGSSGDIVIARPGDIIYHGPTAEMTRGFVNDWIKVEGGDVGDLLSRYPLPIVRPFKASRGLIAHAAAEINSELRFKKSGYEERCYLIIADMVIRLYRSFSETNSMTDTDKFDELCRAMSANLQSDWTVAAMAEQTGYSQSRFCALFKERYGVSAVDYLIGERIEQAKIMLIHSDLPVSAISELCGFSTLFYFSRIFKTRIGTSPTDYRRNGMPEVSCKAFPDRTV